MKMLKKLSHYNLLIPTVFYQLLLAHWEIHHREFKELSKKLGHQNINHATMLTEEQIKQTDKISVVTQKLGKICGFKCLAQAIAAQRLLKKKHIPSELYLGVHKTNGALKAHAWLKCGERYITGKKGSNQFTTVAIYHLPTS